MLVDNIIHSLRYWPDVWAYQQNIHDDYVHRERDKLQVVPSKGHIYAPDRGLVVLGFWDSIRIRKAVRAWQLRPTDA